MLIRRRQTFSAFCSLLLVINKVLVLHVLQLVQLLMAMQRCIMETLHIHKQLMWSVNLWFGGGLFPGCSIKNTHCPSAHIQQSLQNLQAGCITAQAVSFSFPPRRR